MCPRCGWTGSGGDRYCGRCGARTVAVGEQEHPQDLLEPCRRVTIEFGASASPTFPKALEAARRFPAFSEAGEGKAKTFRVEVEWEDWEHALDLVEHLKGWRNRWVYLDGERRDWQEVMYFLNCFNTRRASYNPEHHCVEGQYKNDVNPFGCIHSGLSLVWPSSGWLQAGTFDAELTFHFDKTTMRRILEENLFKVRFCPALLLDRALEVLQTFPASASPRRDRRWEFDTYLASDAPPKKGVPVTVRQYGWLERTEAYGVKPSSRHAAIAILADIAAKLRDSRLPAISHPS